MIAARCARRIPMALRMLATAVVLLTATSLHAQQDKRVYYFIDAFKVDTTSSKHTQIYLYSFPITSLPEKDLNKEQVLADFRQKAKSAHGVSEFTSIVIRTNDSYEEANSLMKTYVDKFARRQYSILVVDPL